MSRKRCHRRAVVPLAPRGLRPKLAREQVTELGVCHMATLDDIAKGRGTEKTLWDMVGAVFTWSRVAERLQAGVPEMAPQLELATRLVERYGRTGLVVFRGVEYQLAKLGIDVMDQLAEIVDKPTAQAAADWSEASVQALADANAVRLERAAA